MPHGQLAGGHHRLGHGRGGDVRARGPVLQMRKSTERPQVYDVGSSVKFDPAEAGAVSGRAVYQEAGGAARPDVAAHARRWPVVGADRGGSPPAAGRKGLRPSQAGAYHVPVERSFRGTACSALSPQAHADGSVQAMRLGVGLAVALSYAFGIAPFESTARGLCCASRWKSATVRGLRSISMGVSLTLVSSLTRTRSPSHLCLRLRSGGFEEHPARPNGRRCRPSPDFRARGGRLGTAVARFEPADLRTWNKSGVQPLDDSASFAFESITAGSHCPCVNLGSDDRRALVARVPRSARAALYALGGSAVLTDHFRWRSCFYLRAVARRRAERLCRRS